mmetsp:Transcript_2274/g.6699  ORF Transcript_2274/g.6699 Transcript_2274/m.6699 type:complete len:269 (-) Transcript_2274:479-1285(-)
MKARRQQKRKRNDVPTEHPRGMHIKNEKVESFCAPTAALESFSSPCTHLLAALHHRAGAARCIVRARLTALCPRLRRHPCLLALLVFERLELLALHHHRIHASAETQVIVLLITLGLRSLTLCLLYCNLHRIIVIGLDLVLALKLSQLLPLAHSCCGRVGRLAVHQSSHGLKRSTSVRIEGLDLWELLILVALVRHSHVWLTQVRVCLVGRPSSPCLHERRRVGFCQRLSSLDGDNDVALRLGALGGLQAAWGQHLHAQPRLELGPEA